MKKIRLKITVSEKSQKSRFYREKREKYKKIHHMVLQNHDTMSVSEREQTKFIHRERRMSIMNEVHDIMSAREPEGACSLLANGELTT